MSPTTPRPAGRNQAFQQPTACHQQRPAQQGGTRQFNIRQHVTNNVPTPKQNQKSPHALLELAPPY
ncbi:protein of unknown function [Cupriavidus taiwanensis]|nr:protein of unknown function [Cupriavidus taiwanensis]SOZ42769.1 protein of unknown function [Cupriavidus taiwanensis]